MDSMQMTHEELEADLETAFREGLEELEAFNLEADLEQFGRANRKNARTRAYSSGSHE